jgi:uncharacterized membrane protein
MKKWIPWIGWTLLAVIVVAIIVNLIVVMRIPNDIMEVTITKKFNYPSNQWIPEPPTSENSTAVIRPSPDNLYSILVYDVSQHPLRVTAAVSEYWSISGFAMNTDNFFNITDTQAKSNPIEVVLISKGMTYQDTTGKANVIEAPSDRGILMIGMVVTNQSALPGLMQIQKQTTAELIK